LILLSEPGESEGGNGVGGEDIDQVFNEFGVLWVAHPVHDLGTDPAGGEDGGEAGEDEGIGGGGEDFGGLLGLFGEIEKGRFQSERKEDRQEAGVGKHHTYHTVFCGGEFAEVQGHEGVVEKPAQHGAKAIDGGLGGQFFQYAHGAKIGNWLGLNLGFYGGVLLEVFLGGGTEVKE